MRSDEVLLTSVPARDRPAVRALLPDAMIIEGPLSADVVAQNPDVAVVSVMIHDPVTPKILAGWAGLRGLVTRSTGFDHLPVAYLRDRGVVPCYLPDYAVPGVAHLTIAFILALLRRLPEAAAVTQGRAPGSRAPSWVREGLVGRHLHDVTVGVFGTGRIGSEVVRLLSALGATIVGYDIAPDERLRRVRGFRYVASLEELVAVSDVLTVHVPLVEGTRCRVDAALLARMRPGGLVVNTARGEVVDQAAVADALASGQLAGYAADVLPGEPRPPDLARFAAAPGALLTPHLGAYDTTSIRARYEHTAVAVRALVAQDEAVIARFRVP